MKKRRFGPDNNNWRGGRRIASNGYVMVRVGTDHPMSNVAGYAYEHRMVMSRVLGRLLNRNEIVHHVNGDKTDNRPENLKLCGSMLEHFEHHRKPGSRLRVHGQKNPLVSCRCGCGMKLRKFDASGRPRYFVSGHNPQRSERMDSIIEAIRNGASTTADIVDRVGVGRRKVALCLSRMVKSGAIQRVARGCYKIGGING